MKRNDVRIDEKTTKKRSSLTRKRRLKRQKLMKTTTKRRKRRFRTKNCGFLSLSSTRVMLENVWDQPGTGPISGGALGKVKVAVAIQRRGGASPSTQSTRLANHTAFL